MNEEREKQIARMLGDYLDGKLPSAATREPELLEGVDTVHNILGMLGRGPELKPEFDRTLRARLVRETRAARKIRSGRPAGIFRSRELRAAAVAAILLLVPSVFVLNERQQKIQKMELLEKYDKMYVPYSKMMSAGGHTEYRPSPFSESFNEEVRRMSRRAAMKRTDSYFNFDAGRRQMP